MRFYGVKSWLPFLYLIHRRPLRPVSPVSPRTRRHLKHVVAPLRFLRSVNNATFERHAFTPLPICDVFFGINLIVRSGRDGGNETMKRCLIAAVALAGLFGGQQAVAKSSTKHAAASTKHNKRHKTKTHAAISAPALTSGAATC